MADDIYFSSEKRKNDLKKNAEKNREYLEKIDKEQLKKTPGELSFNDIVTENNKYPAKKNSGKHEKKHKKSGLPKILSGILISVLLVITLSFAALISYVTADYKSSDFTENAYVSEENLLYSENVYNILLMGIDNLETESSSRSDAMILLSLDTKNHCIKLTSFLRDSYVYIPEIGNMKLNAACVYGGPQLVCDTIEYNFGIKIDDYAKVGYDMFIKIIDAVGGISIPEIDETEARVLREAGFDINPGTDVHADGNLALIYCRIRKGQDDFYRTQRQREVVSLVLKKLALANPLTLITTAREIAETIECSIEKKDIPALAVKSVSCLFSDITQLTIPADGTWYNDTKNYQAVLVLDLEANKERLNDFIYK